MLCHSFPLTLPTIEDTKHRGHSIAPAPLAPPSLCRCSGVSRLGMIRGSRHRNSAITTTTAHTNLRQVGHFRRSSSLVMKGKRI